MDNKIYNLINSSESDLDMFTYMEIGKIHRDSLNWEWRRKRPRVNDDLEITPFHKIRDQKESRGDFKIAS